jgi:hypothetical protein
MHESGRDSAQISRETQKSGSQSDLQRLRGKKVEGRLKPAEADRALDGYSLSSDAGLAAPPRRREVAPSGDERGVGGIYERFQTNKN